MNPRTIRLLSLFCASLALAFSPIAGAAPTPEKPELQAWHKKVFDAIGTYWYHEIQRDERLIALGTAHFSFRVMLDGRVEHLRIISNTSNEHLAGICIRAIKQPKLPPVPASVLKKQGQKWIDIDIPFTVSRLADDADAN